MKQNTSNSNSKAARLLGRVAAEKKKAAVAFCLIALMTLMWVRVLFRQGPASAQARLSEQGATFTDGENSVSEASFIELPKVEGRNDTITRDFFAVGRWRSFVADTEGGEQVSVVSENGSAELARRIAAQLKLQAIIWSDRNPQAFINDTLLSVGDKLTVKDGVSTYECEVVGIEENVVLIRCGEAEIALKLAQVVEVSD